MYPVNMKDLFDFFLEPSHVIHKKYEALRSMFVDGLTSKDTAQKFDYKESTVQSFRRDFILNFKDHFARAQYFFTTHLSGRKKNESKASIVDDIIKLRKQNFSILDIKAILHSKGHDISHDYIFNVLKLDGFSRLPKRSLLEKSTNCQTLIEAPITSSIQWSEEINRTYCSERGIGILPLIPIMADLKIDSWIQNANYPETSVINQCQSILSFLIIKLSGHRRYSHDDIWAMDRGYGLGAGLNVLPKSSTLSSYSYRVQRDMNRKFLSCMNTELDKRGLCSGNINMDFTSIPHWGDESVLENNWSGKRNKSLKSVLAALCQDPDTGILCYSDAELKTADQADFVLEFVDFWREDKRKISCLIFDSKFTTYKNLDKLATDKIKFITIRRRCKKLIDEFEKIPQDSWTKTYVEGRTRKCQQLLLHDSMIQLNKKVIRKFRQIIIANNGHKKPTFIITNDEESSAAEIVRKYGRRWNIEKSISEQIEFFHLNSLSSSIVVKVDFDLTMSVAAHNVYRVVAQGLSGFEKETSLSLNNKFFCNGGQLTIRPDNVMVELKKKRHLPLLIELMHKYRDTKIPWLGGRKLEFCTWSMS